MADPQDLKRREILRHGLLLAAAYLMPHSASAMSILARTDRWEQLATRLLPHTESACVIGRCYLASAPDASHVISTVLARLEQKSAGFHGDADTELIMTVLQSDYEYSRVVEVDGWILSETEVAFCALAALGHA